MKVVKVILVILGLAFVSILLWMVKEERDDMNLKANDIALNILRMESIRDREDFIKQYSVEMRRMITEYMRAYEQSGISKDDMYGVNAIKEIKDMIPSQYYVALYIGIDDELTKEVVNHIAEEVRKQNINIRIDSIDKGFIYYQIAGPVVNLRNHLEMVKTVNAKLVTLDYKMPKPEPLLEPTLPFLVRPYDK